MSKESKTAQVKLSRLRNVEIFAKVKNALDIDNGEHGHGEGMHEHYRVAGPTPAHCYNS